MKCPYCRSEATDVFNTRPTKFGTQIWRRRRCLSCQESFTTYEQTDLGFLFVVKRSGKKEKYSRTKLYNSLHQTFHEVRAKPETVDAVTDTVEAKILDEMKTEISAEDVSRIVLTTLKHFSMPAFLRYLSFQAELPTGAHLKQELKKY